MNIEIKLTRGMVTHVSEEDGASTCFKWQTLKSGERFYAARTVKRKSILLHREILERILARPLLRNEDVDHIDGNGLNNHRGNLRLATRSQNNYNKGLQSNNSSGYIGVCFHIRAKKWMAQIKAEGSLLYLGLFNTAKAAASARDLAAVQHHKEFARLNFPELLEDYQEQLCHRKE